MSVLVLGASGLLGHEIFFYLKNSGVDVDGTHYSHPTIGLRQVDGTNLQQIQDLLYKVNPDVLINAIGNPDPDWCTLNKKRAFSINSLIPSNIAKVPYTKKLIYISTDYVFDGNNNPYEEGDNPCPLNYYGLTKYIGELYSEINYKSIILRLPLIYSRTDIQQMVRGIKEGTLETDYELIKHPTYIGDVAKSIKVLIEKDVTGIYHLGNREGVTRYEWATKIADFFNLSKSGIKKVSPSYIAERPSNVELSMNRSEKLGLRCRKIEEVLEDYDV